MKEISIIDVWKFIKDKEYHEDEKLIFIDSRDFSEFTELFDNFGVECLELYFKGSYFSVNLEDMLDAINSEFTEELIAKRVCRG